MKNEKEILLNTEEIQKLLEGGLFWKDIETKTVLPDIDSIKRNIKDDTEETENIQCKTMEEKITENIREYEEERELRAVLLGEQSVIKDRQINLNYIQEKLIPDEAEASDELAAVMEEAELQKDLDIDGDKGISGNICEDNNSDKVEDSDEFDDSRPREEEGISFTDRSRFDDYFNNNAEEDILEEDTEFQEKPFLSGWKLVVLMGLVAAVTFGFWYYFLSH